MKMSSILMLAHGALLRDYLRHVPLRDRIPWQRGCPDVDRFGDRRSVVDSLGD
jgi:hypothetical protein